MPRILSGLTAGETLSGVSLRTARLHQLSDCPGVGVRSVRISRTALSDWLHREAHGAADTGKWTSFLGRDVSEIVRLRRRPQYTHP